jgi:hypothetical protein
MEMLTKNSFRFFFLHAMILASFAAHSVAPETSPNVMSATKQDSKKLPPIILRVQKLNEMSGKLVVKARSSKTAASAFRIEAVFYREDLRSLMLDNKKIANKKHRIPQKYLLDLVRMSALIHSASECKTGRYIVCPIELMTSLTSQQKKILQNHAKLIVLFSGQI